MSTVRLILFKIVATIGFIALLTISFPFALWQILKTPFTPNTIQSNFRYFYIDIKNMFRNMKIFYLIKTKGKKVPSLNIENMIESFFWCIN